MNKPPLFIIDAYGLIYRSYFAFLTRPLKNSEGKNVSALFGFARALVNLIDDGVPGLNLEKPLLLAAAFDSRTPTFRHKLYPEYKATRQKTPEDLHSQIPLVEEFLTSLGVPLLAAEGFEADDIIAALAAKCRKEKRLCYILSSDKDLLQLVGEGCRELRPVKGSTTMVDGTPYEMLGPDEVKAEWGVNPDRVLDLLSLIGDSSDNVPGVRGIGDKTAIKLMSRYGSLDEIYKNLSGIEGSTGKKLSEGKESAFFSRKLIMLEESVPLSINSIEELSIEKLDRSAGARVLQREGIRQSAKQLDPDIGNKAQDEIRDRGSGRKGEAGIAEVKGIKVEEGVYKVLLKPEELEKLLQKAKKQRLLAIDFETDSLDALNAVPIGISFSLEPKTAFYVPLAAHRGIKANDDKPAPFIDPADVKKLLEPLLSDPEMTIAAHNAKYDYKVSRTWGIKRWKCRIWDTMIAAWLLDPERNNYSLESLAALFFNVEMVSFDDIVPKGGSFDMVPLETACFYSAEDSDMCLRLKHRFEEKLKENNSAKLFEKLEMPLLPILAEMEIRGIKMESNVLNEYSTELGDELEKIQAQTFKVVGHEFNLSSTQQLQKVLFDERKLNPGKKTKTGYSTDVAVLEELARVDEVPALILRHRTLAKLKSTYVDALPLLADDNERLHTDFDQTGTATGRLSSRKPNLQNIPIRDEEGKRIREAFCAASGNVLIAADYSQIELVVLAHLSGDPDLTAAFLDGKDVHARTASLIFKVKEKDVSGAQRRIAKTINFGVMYGMSAFRLSNELQISRSEAAAFIETYFNTYAGIRNYIDGLIRKTESCGYAETLFGRRRGILAINSVNKTEKAAAERIAVNTPIQGTAADIVKTAMLRVDAALSISGSPAALLLQVHDELIFECKKEAAKETAALIKNEMENAVTLSIPLRVSIETGKRWA